MDSQPWSGGSLGFCWADRPLFLGPLGSGCLYNISDMAMPLPAFYHPEICSSLSAADSSLPFTLLSQDYTFNNLFIIILMGSGEER